MPQKLLASGRKVYNLSVGTPDFPVAEHVQNALIEAAKDPEKFHYTLRDIPELTAAVKDYYQRRFGVTLSEDEIVAMPGSQEGVAHIGMALCNPGDVVLLPNPGYPVFEVGAYLGDAELYFYDLKEENDFLPRFDEIPEDIARRAKYIMVSYPYNPVCAIAPPEFYEELISFAEKYNIIVVHDNAYSDIIYDGVYGGSFLEHDHAKEVRIEAFSLSKSFNMTGARVSFFVGNKQIIDAIKLLRSQYDFGIFEPIQRAAIAALMTLVNDIYKAGSISKDDLVTFIKLLSPFAPHLTEEIYAGLKGEDAGFLTVSAWPEFDPAKTVDDMIEVGVQVNGKVRAAVQIARDADKETALATAKANERVASFMEGKKLIKEIYVPGKIINFVVK